MHHLDDVEDLKDQHHQVFIKVTELTVPESPPRRDSHPLLVKKMKRQTQKKIVQMIVQL